MTPTNQGPSTVVAVAVAVATSAPQPPATAADAASPPAAGPLSMTKTGLKPAVALNNVATTTTTTTTTAFTNPPPPPPPPHTPTPTPMKRASRPAAVAGVAAAAAAVGPSKNRKKLSSKATASPLSAERRRSASSSTTTTTSSPSKRSATTTVPSASSQKKKKQKKIAATTTTTKVAASTTTTTTPPSTATRFYPVAATMTAKPTLSTLHSNAAQSLNCRYCDLLTTRIHLVKLKPCGCKVCNHCFIQWFLLPPPPPQEEEEEEEGEEEGTEVATIPHQPHPNWFLRPPPPRNHNLKGIFCRSHCQIHCKLVIQSSYHPLRRPPTSHTKTKTKTDASSQTTAGTVLEHVYHHEKEDILASTNSMEAAAVAAAEVASSKSITSHHLRNTDGGGQSQTCRYCQVKTYRIHLVKLNPCGCFICTHCFIQWYLLQLQEQKHYRLWRQAEQQRRLQNKFQKHPSLPPSNSPCPWPTIQQQYLHNRCCNNYYCRIHCTKFIKSSFHPLRNPSSTLHNYSSTVPTPNNATVATTMTTTTTTASTAASTIPAITHPTTISLMEHTYHLYEEEEEEEVQVPTTKRQGESEGGPVGVRRAEAESSSVAPPATPLPPPVKTATIGTQTEEDEELDKDVDDDDDEDDDDIDKEYEDWKRKDKKQFEQYYELFYNQSLPRRGRRRYVHFTVKERVYLLLGFYAQHGHFQIPKDTNENKILRIHYHNIRSGRTILKEEDKQLLINKTGLVFEPIVPQYLMTRREDELKNRVLQTIWTRPLPSYALLPTTPKEQVELLLDFYDEHDTFVIPKDTDRHRLLSVYSHCIRKGKIVLDDTDKQLLLDKGFLFHKSIDERIQDYITYRNDHNGQDVPCNASSLGKWCIKLRQGLTKNLTDEQRARLDAAGFRWHGNKYETVWWENLEKLKAYKAQYGDTCIPYAWPQNKSLSSWVHGQRKKRLKGELRADRVQALNDIDFAWHGKQGKRNRTWKKPPVTESIEESKQWIANYHQARIKKQQQQQQQQRLGTQQQKGKGKKETKAAAATTTITAPQQRGGPGRRTITGKNSKTTTTTAQQQRRPPNPNNTKKKPPTTTATATATATTTTTTTTTTIATDNDKVDDSNHPISWSRV